MFSVQCSVFCIKKWASVLVTMSLKKFLIANRSGSTVANCNISRCTMNIVIEYVEYSTFSFSNGDVVIFRVYGCSNALQLATSSFIAKNWKLNWNETKRYHVFLTKPNYIYDYKITTLYYSTVADVECWLLCTMHNAHSVDLWRFIIIVASCQFILLKFWFLVFFFRIEKH